MTSEDDFHSRIDANVDDWDGRGVLADWLQDHGDPRAEGYRALSVLRRTPHFAPVVKDGSKCPTTGYQIYIGGYQWLCCVMPSFIHCHFHLPELWFLKIKGLGKSTTHKPLYNVTAGLLPAYSRREVEDAAALAWGKLSKKSKELVLSMAVLLEND